MPDSAASSLADGAHQWARISLVGLVVGPSILLIYAWVEVLNHGGLSLVGGYLIGREPWTSAGIVVSLAGAVGGVLSGSVAVAIEGGWWRRFLIIPAFVAALLWWGTALGTLPYPEFHGPDPVAFAYLLPAATALLLLMPAALLATLSVTPRVQAPPRMRMRPVPSAPRAERTWITEDEADPDEP